MQPVRENAEFRGPTLTLPPRKHSLPVDQLAAGLIRSHSVWQHDRSDAVFPRRSARELFEGMGLTMRRTKLVVLSLSLVATTFLCGCHCLSKLRSWIRRPYCCPQVTAPVEIYAPAPSNLVSPCIEVPPGQNNLRPQPVPLPDEATPPALPPAEGDEA